MRNDICCTLEIAALKAEIAIWERVGEDFRHAAQSRFEEVEALKAQIDWKDGQIAIFFARWTRQSEDADRLERQVYAVDDVIDSIRAGDEEMDSPDAIVRALEAARSIT